MIFPDCKTLASHIVLVEATQVQTEEEKEKNKNTHQQNSSSCGGVGWYGSLLWATMYLRQSHTLKILFRGWYL
jgi:cell envelope opacity-associated protein A